MVFLNSWRVPQKITLFIVVGAGATLGSVAAETQKPLTWIESARTRWEKIQPQNKPRIDLYRALIQHNDFMPAARGFKGAITKNHFASWLKDSFSALAAGDDSIYQLLKQLQTRIITTNYDTIIEKYTGMNPVDPSDLVGIGACFTHVEPQVFRAWPVE